MPRDINKLPPPVDRGRRDIDSLPPPVDMPQRGLGDFAGGAAEQVGERVKAIPQAAKGLWDYYSGGELGKDLEHPVQAIQDKVIPAAKEGFTGWLKNMVDGYVMGSYGSGGQPAGSMGGELSGSNYSRQDEPYPQQTADRVFNDPLGHLEAPYAPGAPVLGEAAFVNTMKALKGAGSAIRKIVKPTMEEFVSAQAKTIQKEIDNVWESIPEVDTGYAEVPKGSPLVNQLKIEADSTPMLKTHTPKTYSDALTNNRWDDLYDDYTAFEERQRAADKFNTRYEDLAGEAKPAPTSEIKIETKPGPAGGKDVVYDIAGDVVDGRTVRDYIPNTESIGATLTDYTEVNGIRDIPLSEFDLTGKHYSVEGTKRIKKLASEIKDSGEINPLIVVLDSEGAYILEGGTRAEALYTLDAKSLPAKVVIDNSNPPLDLAAKAKTKPNAPPKAPVKAAANYEVKLNAEKGGLEVYRDGKRVKPKEAIKIAKPAFTEDDIAEFAGLQNVVNNAGMKSFTAEEKAMYDRFNKLLKSYQERLNRK